MDEAIRVLLASSEVFPFSKTGGLADMVGALAKYLARSGARVGVISPLYRGIRDRFSGIQDSQFKIDLPVGPERVQAGIWTFHPEPNLTHYFVDQPGMFDRAGLYQEDGRDYPDNARRFIFFSKCIGELARNIPWEPNLVHLHDWQTALAALLIRQDRWNHTWPEAPPCCMTIHNLAYQGAFARENYYLTNLPPEFFHPDGLEFYGGFNCLKGGVVYSDAITTVSPRYAREITRLEFGFALDGLLRRRQDVLTGILNGVDYTEWRSEDNPALRHSFSASDLSGKALEKRALQEELGLRIQPDAPLFGSVTRLADQKGVDLLAPAVETMIGEGIQFVLLGSGDPAQETVLQKLAMDHADSVAVRIGFDPDLAHRIEAGCDFFLMPSRFEPCGLNQMYSMRYGTIPVVRATGGLDDSVTDIRESIERCDGIKFNDLSVEALIKAMQKAVAVFREPDLLRHYRLNAMKRDFSWEVTASRYAAIYERLIQLKTETAALD